MGTMILRVEKMTFTHEEYVQSLRISLVDTAKKVLSGLEKPVGGVRLISSLLRQIGEAEDPEFSMFRAVASETDDFVLGEHRRHYSDAYLEKNDRERRDYLLDTEKDIMMACETIIERFGERPS